MNIEARKYHYIYKITRNDGSGKYYIGMHSTNDLNDNYFGSGIILAKSIKKYGKATHIKEILEFCDSRNHLCDREKEIIGDYWKYDDCCMNVKPGGLGGWQHIKEKNARPCFIGIKLVKRQRILLMKLIINKKKRIHNMVKDGFIILPLTSKAFLKMNLKNICQLVGLPEEKHK